MIYTTLNRIREHSPCADGWRKLLRYLGKTEADNEPLAYSTILESNGLDDALWCLRAEPQHESIWRMYAVRTARSVQQGERSIQVLDVAERHARGAAKDSELAAARAAARASWAAAGTAGWDAALAAARAAGWDAAWAATGTAGWYAAVAAARAEDAGWDAAEDAAEDAIRADFERMLAAHHAMPGEPCALVDWWEEIAA